MWILSFYWDGARPSAEANLSPLRTKTFQPQALRIPRKWGSKMSVNPQNVGDTSKPATMSEGQQRQEAMQMSLLFSCQNYVSGHLAEGKTPRGWRETLWLGHLQHPHWETHNHNNSCSRGSFLASMATWTQAHTAYRHTCIFTIKNKSKCLKTRKEITKVIKAIKMTRQKDSGKK